jgi:hypothetical protein
MKKHMYPLNRRLGGSKADLDVMEKKKYFTLQGLELRLFGHPARG